MAYKIHECVNAPGKHPIPPTYAASSLLQFKFQPYQERSKEPSNSYLCYMQCMPRCQFPPCRAQPRRLGMGRRRPQSAQHCIYRLSPRLSRWKSLSLVCKGGRRTPPWLLPWESRFPSGRQCKTHFQKPPCISLRHRQCKSRRLAPCTPRCTRMKWQPSFSQEMPSLMGRATPARPCSRCPRRMARRSCRSRTENDHPHNYSRPKNPSPLAMYNAQGKRCRRTPPWLLPWESSSPSGRQCKTHFQKPPCISLRHRQCKSRRLAPCTPRCTRMKWQPSFSQEMPSLMGS
jgi:hypothetical protein